MKTFVSAVLSLCCGLLSLGAADKIAVSSFSTVLTEIVERVGGDRVVVTGHIKPGVDPHQFELKPSDLEAVAAATLILISSKHMENYVDKLKESTGTKAMVVEIGGKTAPIKSGRDATQSIEDPHWWNSISQVKRAVRIVADALRKLRPADKELFAQNAAKYTATLDALAQWAKREIARLPRNTRHLVTSHDAFQFFARDYGFTVHAVEGLSSAEQPSSRRVAGIIHVIKAHGVKAIFAEDLSNPKVLQEITRETGARLGGTLYADGLGPGEASTYEGMYRHNVSTIVEALQ